MKVKDLIIYPIKSLGGVSVQSATCEEQGFRYDRRMMLVDEEGNFLTQRTFPRLALLSSSFSQSGFLITHKNQPELSIEVPFEPVLGEKIGVKVWKHIFEARKIDSLQSWFSDYLGSKVKLVKMTAESVRYKSLTKAPSRTKLSLADGYPYLVISESSLADLNERLEVPVSMDRFRPNIVLGETEEAYSEEKLDKISIGDLPFRMIKGCVRCNMITIDQKTGKKLVEPLKTLSTYKREGNNVYFGMNAVSLSEGQISTGDIVSKI